MSRELNFLMPEEGTSKTCCLKVSNGTGKTMKCTLILSFSRFSEIVSFVVKKFLVATLGSTRDYL